MFKQIGLTKKIFALGSFVFLFAGCSGSNVSSSVGLSAVNAADSGPVPGSSAGIADPSQFFVGVDVTVNDVAHVHIKDAFSSKCAITPSATMNDVDCYVDIPEGELYINGLSFIYNVPAGMCKFLRRRTYWYYNQEVGIAASSIQISRTYSGTPSVLTAYSCQIDSGPAGVAACTTDPEVTIDVTKTPPVATCIYDKTKQGDGNGCFGNYSMTVTDRTTTPSSDVTTVLTTYASWGGTVGSVLGGAAKYGWDTAKDGTPLDIVTKAGAGLSNEAYVLPAPIKSIDSLSTLELANYYSGSDHSHSGFYAATTTTKPYYVDPIDDRTGSLIAPANHAYQYDCLDAAFEVKQRISVFVREWDTYQDFSNYVTSAGAAVNEIPDRRVGNEGPVGSPTCEGIAGPCNDFYDADDFVHSLIGGIYNTSLPSLLNRTTYFPNIKSK